MATANLTVTVGIKLIEEPASGEPCVACGDRVFLKAWFISVCVGKNKKGSGRLQGQLCSSCGDAFREGKKREEDGK